MFSSLLWYFEFFCFFAATSSVPAPTIFTEFVALNYSWDSTHQYSDYQKLKKYEPSNCLLAGIKLDKDNNIYVTVPRWRPSIPGTLNKLVYSTEFGEYRLSPYPSWDMQEEGVDGDLQNCQSMAIDGSGFMWAIETGRRNFFAPLQSMWVDGTPGIWIIDMASSTVVQKYYFPAEVASPSSSFVNDIVIDESRDVAYLTDAWGEGGLIVYDRGQGSSRRYSGPSTKNDPSYTMIINGVDYGTSIFTTPSDGIAMTEGGEALLYGAVQGTTLYRMATELLRDFSSTQEQLDDAAETIGWKEPSDGMQYVQGKLYFGSLPSSTYYVLPINATSFPDTSTEAIPATPEPSNMRWVSVAMCPLYVLMCNVPP